MNYFQLSNSVVEVHVTGTHIFKFPNPDAKCSAHGQRLCIKCARNPSTCVNEGGCSVYLESGMHWDTCPNRIP